jgi:hypothetical protein
MHTAVYQTNGVNSIGAINFLFALPAVRSIDTMGRRRWLLVTLPFMALFMLGAGLSFMIETPAIRIGVAAFFLFSAYMITYSCVVLI